MPIAEKTVPFEYDLEAHCLTAAGSGSQPRGLTVQQWSRPDDDVTSGTEKKHLFSSNIGQIEINFF